MRTVDTAPIYPIKAVARRTGLSTHVIRVWERRYAAVVPKRSPTARRLYSEADIERLRLLCAATRAGHSIGQIARLATERLAQLVETDHAATLPSSAAPPGGRPGARESSRADVAPRWSAAAPGTDPSHASHTRQWHLTNCLSAVERLDAEALDETLARASVELSQPDLMDGVLVPLMGEIGDRWRQGELRVAHEHLASAVVRTFLGSLARGT